MSATVLLDAIVDKVKELFPKDVHVEEYAGQFNAEEIERGAFRCPCVLISVLGWSSADGSRRLGAARNARMHQIAAFVVTDRVNRNERMRLAAVMADALCYGMRDWNPALLETHAIGGLEDEPAAENMYGKAIDKHGLAMWMVTWEQAVQPIKTPQELFDLVAVEITSTATLSVDPEPDSAPALDVAEEILFKTIEG